MNKISFLSLSTLLLTTLMYSSTACTQSEPEKKKMTQTTLKKGEIPTLHKMGLKATKSLPKAKECLSGPDAGSLSDDRGMMTNNGLSSQQINKAMNKFFPQLSDCMPDVWPTASIELDFNVGCDGRVSYVSIVKDDGMDFAIQQCIEESFKYAEFPAHDLPDGMDFNYPIQFEPG